MLKTIKYEEIENNWLDKNYVFIDVRSPSEYNSETIPGAINIPIFNDEERSIIGTIYKQESIEKAKKVGIDFVSKKLPTIYEKIMELKRKYDNLIFFCARGGMRSNSLVSFLESIGINVFKLDGGYKSYRKYIYTHLPDLIKNIQFIVLYGNTGTGKTLILENLKKKGMDILDLEGCANHRGSILGSVGLGKQNSQKMFESLLYESLIKRKSNLVFIEGESRRIGKDIIPEYLFKAMQKGINIKVEANIKTRITNILDSYVHDTDNELIESLDHLRKHLGDKNIDRYINLVKNHQYNLVAEELMIKYYDPMYEHNDREYCKVFNSDDIENVTNNIIQWVDEFYS
ncbi:tRNA 2-selenouridine(34) synthase MnmH [Schnuerera sp.]|uniref:tRNA 2-selenouridine(34) synthase MnmH n=1 Tax=Schnuerera sp. TaxID=2794844 RepID=UPI002CA86FE9|nr:tRNA 2-selenouridine(34) synthase MnmH [Schnuerera sp.]HSH34933.1 tRNA 2-selenouridine(34) synthase MnmH [Schnuerera sp.]